MKRGDTGLCFVAAIDKPTGLTSHDVVSRVRRATGEKRVGHAGTLDPMATGILPVLVGPAARLNTYLSAEQKTYVCDIVFGTSTTTDDAEGEIIRSASIPSETYDPIFATTFLSQLKGAQKQLPPAYSAIKKDGKKACDEARKGRVLDLSPRDIYIYQAELLAIEIEPTVIWRVKFEVSKGTYIRALARDIGVALDSAAHIGSLRRTSFGSISIEDCVTLPTFFDSYEVSILDVVKLLGYPIVFGRKNLTDLMNNGAAIELNGVEIYEYLSSGLGQACACSSGLVECKRELTAGDLVSAVDNNKLKGIYEYDAQGLLKPRCIFNVGVSRGACI